MNAVSGVYRDGRLELNAPVDWPNGTTVEVTPLPSPGTQSSWISLPPLDVGRLVEINDEDDILGEMLSDSRD